MHLAWPQPNRTFGFVDALGLTGLLGLLAARFLPVARLPFWECALRKNTGWPCPGCGLTRAAEGVALGNFGAAWDANPFGTIAAILFGLAAVLAFLHLAFKLPVPKVSLTPRESSVLRWSIAAAALSSYAYVVAVAKLLNA
jgi:hypothetical protein